MTLFSVLLEFLVDLNCLQARVSYIIHHRARPLVRRDVCSTSLATAHVQQSVVDSIRWHASVATHPAKKGTFLCDPASCIAALQSACALQSLRSATEPLLCTIFALASIGDVWIDILVLSGRSEVAHSRHEVFHGLDWCLILQVWLQTLK